jgi:hypothetical protein
MSTVGVHHRRARQQELPAKKRSNLHVIIKLSRRSPCLVIAIEEKQSQLNIGKKANH